MHSMLCETNQKEFDSIGRIIQKRAQGFIVQLKADSKYSTLDFGVGLRICDCQKNGLHQSDLELEIIMCFRPKSHEENRGSGHRGMTESVSGAPTQS